MLSRLERKRRLLACVDGPSEDSSSGIIGNSGNGNSNSHHRTSHPTPPITNSSSSSNPLSSTLSHMTHNEVPLAARLHQQQQPHHHHHHQHHHLHHHHHSSNLPTSSSSASSPFKSSSSTTANAVSAAMHQQSQQSHHQMKTYSSNHTSINENKQISFINANERRRISSLSLSSNNNNNNNSSKTSSSKRELTTGTTNTSLNNSHQAITPICSTSSFLTHKSSSINVIAGAGSAVGTSDKPKKTSSSLLPNSIYNKAGPGRKSSTLSSYTQLLNNKSDDSRVMFDYGPRRDSEGLDARLSRGSSMGLTSPSHSNMLSRLERKRRLLACVDGPSEEISSGITGISGDGHSNSHHRTSHPTPPITNSSSSSNPLSSTLSLVTHNEVPTAAKSHQQQPHHQHQHHHSHHHHHHNPSGPTSSSSTLNASFKPSSTSSSSSSIIATNTHQQSPQHQNKSFPPIAASHTSMNENKQATLTTNDRRRNNSLSLSSSSSSSKTASCKREPTTGTTSATTTTVSQQAITPTCSASSFLTHKASSINVIAGAGSAVGTSDKPKKTSSSLLPNSIYNKAGPGQKSSTLSSYTQLLNNKSDDSRLMIDVASQAINVELQDPRSQARSGVMTASLSTNNDETLIFTKINSSSDDQLTMDLIKVTSSELTSKQRTKLKNPTTSLADSTTHKIDDHSSSEVSSSSDADLSKISKKSVIDLPLPKFARATLTNNNNENISGKKPTPDRELTAVSSSNKLLLNKTPLLSLTTKHHLSPTSLASFSSTQPTATITPMVDYSKFNIRKKTPPNSMNLEHSSSVATSISVPLASTSSDEEKVSPRTQDSDHSSPQHHQNQHSQMLQQNQQHIPKQHLYQQTHQKHQQHQEDSAEEQSSSNEGVKKQIASITEPQHQVTSRESPEMKKIEKKRTSDAVIETKEDVTKEKVEENHPVTKQKKSTLVEKPMKQIGLNEKTDVIQEEKSEINTSKSINENKIKEEEKTKRKSSSFEVKKSRSKFELKLKERLQAKSKESKFRVRNKKRRVDEKSTPKLKNATKRGLKNRVKSKGGMKGREKAKQRKSSLFVYDEEPIYLSMYDKVKARSSANQSHTTTTTTSSTTPTISSKSSTKQDPPKKSQKRQSKASNSKRKDDDSDSAEEDNDNHEEASEEEEKIVEKPVQKSPLRKPKVEPEITQTKKPRNDKRIVVKDFELPPQTNSSSNSTSSSLSSSSSSSSSSASSSSSSSSDEEEEEEDEDAELTAIVAEAAGRIGNDMNVIEAANSPQLSPPPSPVTMDASFLLTPNETKSNIEEHLITPSAADSWNMVTQPIHISLNHHQQRSTPNTPSPRKSSGTELVLPSPVVSNIKASLTPECSPNTEVPSLPQEAPTIDSRCETEQAISTLLMEMDTDTASDEVCRELSIEVDSRSLSSSHNITSQRTPSQHSLTSNEEVMQAFTKDNLEECRLSPTPPSNDDDAKSEPQLSPDTAIEKTTTVSAQPTPPPPSLPSPPAQLDSPKLELRLEPDLREAPPPVSSAQVSPSIASPKQRTTSVTAEMMTTTTTITTTLPATSIVITPGAPATATRHSPQLKGSPDLTPLELPPTSTPSLTPTSVSIPNNVSAVSTSSATVTSRKICDTPVSKNQLAEDTNLISPEEAKADVKRVRRSRKKSIHIQLNAPCSSESSPQLRQNSGQPAKMSPYDIFEFRDSDDDETTSTKNSSGDNSANLHIKPSDASNISTVKSSLSPVALSTNLLQTVPTMQQAVATVPVQCATSLSPKDTPLNLVQVVKPESPAIPVLPPQQASSTKIPIPPVNCLLSDITQKQPTLNPSTVSAPDIPTSLLQIAEQQPETNAHVTVEQEAQDGSVPMEVSQPQHDREYITELNQDGKLSLTIRKASNQSREVHQDMKTPAKVQQANALIEQTSTLANIPETETTATPQPSVPIATEPPQVVTESKPSGPSTPSTNVKPTRRSARLMQSATKDKKEPSSNEDQTPREPVAPQALPTQQVRANTTSVASKEGMFVSSNTLTENQPPSVSLPVKENPPPTVISEALKESQPVVAQDQAIEPPPTKTRRNTRGKKVAVKTQQQQVSQVPPAPKQQEVVLSHQTPQLTKQLQQPAEQSQPLPQPHLTAPPQQLQQQHQQPQTQPQAQPQPQPPQPPPQPPNQQQQNSSTISTTSTETRPKRLTRLAVKTLGINDAPSINNENSADNSNPPPNDENSSVPSVTVPAPVRDATPIIESAPITETNKPTPFCIPSYLPPRKRLGWFWSQKQLLEQRYLVVWTTRFSLKDSFAAVQMHFISGNNKMPSWSYRAMLDETAMPLPIQINQRMRLDPDQLEGVQRKLANEEDHCVLLAVPVGRDQSEYAKQSDSLRVGFIDYLISKQAAGIVYVCQPGESQPSYIIHIFPSCTFVNEHILRREPDLLNVIQNIDNLIVVITTA